MLGIALDIVGKALDLLIKGKTLANWQKRKKRLFLQYVEPAFQSVNPVFDQYADQFLTIREFIDALSDNPDQAQSLEKLYDDRRKIVRDRNALVAPLKSALSWMEKSLTSKRDKPTLKALQKFDRELSEFFYFNELATMRDRLDTSESHSFITYIERFVIRDGRIGKQLKKQRRTLEERKSHGVEECERMLRRFEEKARGLRNSYEEFRLFCLEG